MGNNIFLINKKCILVWFVLIFLFVIELFVLPDNVVVHLFMLFFSIYVFTFLYNYNNGFLTISNIFILLFYGVSIIFRYFYTCINPDSFQEFSLYSFGNNIAGLLKTIVFLFVTGLFYKFGLILGKNRIQTRNEAINFHIKNKSVLITLFYLLLLSVLFYRIKNLTTAVSSSYSTFDYMVTIITQLIKVIAYLFLYFYFTKKDYSGLIIYASYAAPFMIFSLVSAWKGTFLYEVLTFILIFYLAKNKIKMKYIVISIISFVIVYYFINQYRVYLIHGTPITFNLTTIRTYVVNDFLGEISNRFEGFDLLVYTLNSPNEMMDYLRANSSPIISTFFKTLIPRFLWPGKGIVSNLPLLLKQYFFGHSGIYSNSNITYLGELYLYYGIIGCCAYNVFFGWLCNQDRHNTDDNYLENTDYYSLVKYVMLWQIVIQSFEGSISGKIIMLIMTLTICWLFKFLFLSQST